MAYVTFKSMRSSESISYDGPTWDAAEIHTLRRDTYVDREARRGCGLLSESNPVGFSVGEA